MWNVGILDPPRPQTGKRLMLESLESSNREIVCMLDYFLTIDQFGTRARAREYPLVQVSSIRKEREIRVEEPKPDML